MSLLPLLRITAGTLLSPGSRTNATKRGSVLTVYSEYRLPSQQVFEMHRNDRFTPRHNNTLSCSTPTGLMN